MLRSRLLHLSQAAVRAASARGGRPVWPALCATSLALLGMTAPAHARQDQPARQGAKMHMAGSPAPAADKPRTPLAPDDVQPPDNPDEIGFAADQIVYDDATQTVTASGNVQIARDGNLLRADKVVWNRATGAVEASGTVKITDNKGNVGYGDQIAVTDTLRDGVVENMLLVLERGGRIAARHGEHVGNAYILDHAAYTPCPVEDSKGCPKTPSWELKAVRVIYRPERDKISYRNARLELFGVPVAVLPAFSHPATLAGGTGFLVPGVGLGGNNGIEIATPFYVKLASNRDVTVTPHVYTATAPMVEATYRAFSGAGAYRVTGAATYGRRIDAVNGVATRDLRGYFEASGKYQFSPEWSFSSSLRRTTDRTFLRRYNISRDDRLRSTVALERIGTDSYFSMTGWAVQGLRPTDVTGQMPIALPVIDYRLRTSDPLLGGRLLVHANSLAITRTAGQDTQRAFVGAEWSLRQLTRGGQEIALTGYARGDLYHSSDNLLTPTGTYRGQTGWQTRGITAAAIDIRWPLIGPAFGGVQRITPRVQLAVSPQIANLIVPNEDARAVELDDSNLFALNRFPGYDRFEDGPRVTAGVEYALALRDFTIETVVGQSYRLNNRATILPNGTGLSDRVSDVVGRTTVRYRDFLTISHRFRLDKDNLAVRRNEVDATIGSRRTYAQIGYLRLNRNVTTNIEDLFDREELRVGGRVQITRFVSIFGSTVIDMTGKSEDPLSLGDGFNPVRHRIGIAYQDDCLDLGFTWRRDYQEIGDARQTSTFELRLAFRNLGI